IDLFITQYGNLAHISENMGAYRIHSGGIWQGANTKWIIQEKLFRAGLLFNDNVLQKKYNDFLRTRLKNALRKKLRASDLFTLRERASVIKELIKIGGFKSLREFVRDLFFMLKLK
ncbi:MAG: hypothetical protein ACPG5P_08475, partial [Saprospiraceae bacterium]